MMDIATKTKANLSRLLPFHGVSNVEIDVKKEDDETVLITFKNADHYTFSDIKQLPFVKKHMVKIYDDESEIKYRYSPRKTQEELQSRNAGSA